MVKLEKTLIFVDTDTDISDVNTPELELSKSTVLDIPWPPIIVITPSGWQAAVKWNNKSVIIRQDGRAWVK